MANNQPTRGPPYPKIKYSDSKFRDIIPNLPLFESIKIQYKAKGVWFKMISKRGNFYNCECCGVDNVGPTPLISHLRGKKHRLALQSADKLFHPQYTVARDTKSPARTPILDAYLGVEEGPKPSGGSSNASNRNNKSDNATATTQKSKPGPASAQKPKPGGDSAAQKSKTDGSVAASQPKTNTPIQKPGPACSKKPINAAAANNKSAPSAANNKASLAAKTAKGNDSPATGAAAAAKPAAAAAVKPSEIAAASKETATVVKKENEEKKPEEKSTATTKAPQKDSEIVILDDDDEDTSNKKQPLSNKPAMVQNTPSVGQAIPVAGTAVPKSQRLQKRNLNTQPPKQQSGNNIPPANRIINPAAVIAQSAEEQQIEDEKPRYIQNRVIIPSVNRKRDQQQLGNDQLQQQPNFSKKTFSPKLTGSSDYEGIIGVEYVVKILKVYNDPDPFYECCLCEVVMDGIGMQTHLLGYNHRYKYIEKHFPTCFNQYKEHIGNIQVLGIILDRVAKAIESHHGRELPYECLSGEFRSNRQGVMTTVYSFRHASEYSGPSFTNCIDNKEVDELCKNKITYVPPKPDPKRKPTFDTRGGGGGAPPVAKKGRMDRERERDRNDRDRDRERPYLSSSGRGHNSRRPYREDPEPESTVDDATHKLLVEEFLNHTRGKSRSPVGRRNRRHRSRSRSPRHHQRSSQHHDRRRSVSPLREGDIWQAYRHLVDRSKNELDQVYKEYRKDPEKHPVYDEEWRKFWKHRKDQLTREGLDHRNYDFQPEWVRYFAVRVEELYDEAVEDIKISSRRRLILPMTNDELEDKKYHVKIVVPTEVDEPQQQQQQYQQQQQQQQQQQYQQQEQQKEQHENKFDHPQPSFTETTSVVGVLRLLTALEDYLGSLGPKVVDLLSKALLVEKTNPRDINEIILNLENCTVLETAMEKLKGVLIAGLLEGPKVRAFNNVITETDKILRIAYKIRQEKPQPVVVQRPQPVPAPKVQQQQQGFQQKSFSPQTQNTLGGGGGSNSGAAASLLSQIDKKELATKLAAALTAQGKTDFNPEQLQQLIAVYSLIDKKKRDSAAASDKQKMTLSDTLTALLNPSSSDKSGGGDGNIPLLSNRMGLAARANFSNSNNNDKFGSVSNSSINNFVSMLNRDDPTTGGGSVTNESDSNMWQNLQNIQSSLRLQNNSSNSGAGFGGNNSAANVGGRNFGGNNSNMGNVGGGVGNFNRSGFVGGQTSGNDFNSGQQNFNRSGGFSGGGNNSNNNSMNDFDAGFRSGFQSMNNSNPSRLGGNDDNMITGGRGVNDMMGGGGNDMMDIGGRGGGNDMISRGRGGNDMMMTGGRVGGLSGNNNNFSGGGGGGNFPSRGSTGTGANNTLGFARGSFLGAPTTGASGYNNNFSGLSNFSTSINPIPGNNNFQRNSSVGMGGGAGAGNNNGPQMGGGNFNQRAGQPNFNNGFNNQQNKNGGPTFGSAPNQRNSGGGNQGVNNNNNNNQAGRGGAGWRNQ